MAKQSAVWGIDIGRCALKALRCRVDGDAVVADGFDYIEYPKLLTQPEADAPQLIKEALEQFLSRNSLKDDKVAVSVSGESGLARYFKPPPVDVKKIADIVKYEARQQIPFALEDVIWDYQRLPGGQEVEGFALDTEIGLFAMKREQVDKALAPYNAAEVEVDVIQLAPIALYNYVAHDISKGLPEGQDYDSESPPPSIVVLSIGTDTTDLVVTNGFRVWQRNIPLGGNHFTKQLSKELKLTFAKAEHLKRNPKTADDPKTIFQAMRPVFADMVTEVQRSIGFFQSLDRKAKIASVVMLGNTVKLPGLTQYLSKHLGYEVKEIDSFNKLSGATVVTSPSFKDNILGFATCYGLCLQGLNKGKLSTNLLPREILTQRMIKAKKPWAVAAVSALVLGFALSYVFYYQVWNQVHDDKMVQGVTWKQAVEEAKNVSGRSSTLIGEDKKKQTELALIQRIGQEVAGGTDRRVMWMEVLKAINTSLPPMDPTGTIVKPGDPPPDPQKLPLVKRQDLKVEYIESQFYPDLSVWFSNEVKRKYLELNSQLVGGAQPAASSATPSGAAATPPAAGAPSSTPPAASGSTPAGVPSSTPAGVAGSTPPGGGGASSTSMPGAIGGGGTAPVASQADVSGVALEGPKGPGWVIEIKGHHFFNDPANRRAAGPAHLRNTLLRNLEQGWIDVPAGPGRPLERFTHKELGIGFAILALDPPIREFIIPNPNAEPTANDGSSGGVFGGPMDFGGGQKLPGKADAKDDPNNPPVYKVPRYDFIVQFCWQEKPLGVRLADRELKRKQLEEQQAANPPAAAAPAPAGTPAAVTPAPGVPAVAVPPTTGTPATPAPVEGAAPPPAAPLPTDPAAPMPPAVEPAAAAAPMPAIPAVPDAAPPAAPPAAPDIPEAPAEAPAAAPIPNTP
jgi:type IV pilus assembly protein PilM